MVGSTFIVALLAVATIVPVVLIGFGVGAAAYQAGGEEAAVPFVILIVVLSLPLIFYVFLGLSLAPEAVAIEGYTAVESIKRSWSIVKGNRLRLLLYYIVTGIVAFLGLFACCIGVIFTSTLVYIAYMDSYLRLVRPIEEQSAWTVS